MKFDTVIIGGGLSGLIAGIRLVEAGQKCAIISSGQSALHFSSGSFDLLNYLPNGEKVDNPFSKIDEFVSQAPNHPYAKLGSDKFTKIAKATKEFMNRIGVPVFGDEELNHYRVTPMGTLKPTWLTVSDFAVSTDENKLPWKSVAIFNISGFLDFYPKFIADEFAKLGTESIIHHFTLPDIDQLRRNPTEMRSTNIAWALDKENNKSELIKILKDGSKDYECIILPAIIGMKNPKLLQEMEDAVGKPIHIIPTLPPSIVGIRTQNHMHDYFSHHGGVYMLGDNILKADIEDNKVKRVYSFNHQDIPFQADNFILATGSYFSQGLIAEQYKVVEPLFDLDVKQTKTRPEWYDPDMFKKQNYQTFGVKTDKEFKGIKDGKAIDNLYVAGAILEDFDAIKEGTGSGVSILSSMDIADRILTK